MKTPRPNTSRESSPTLVESLEPRRLMSVALDAYGILRIEGTANADTITVDYNGAGGYVVNGASLTAKTYAGAAVNLIAVQSGDGDDTIKINVLEPALVEAGGGSDYVKTGGLNDVVFGDESWVSTVEAGTVGTVAWGASIVNVLSDAPPSGYWALTTGAAGDDVIETNNGSDRIYANAGNDSVYAGPNNDEIDGGAGIDKLYGDYGDDIFHAADGGFDRIYGGAGYDKGDFDLAPSFWGLRTDVLESVEGAQPSGATPNDTTAAAQALADMLRAYTQTQQGILENLK